MCPFYEASDASAFGFCLGFRSQDGSLACTFCRLVQWIPQIHLWCDTCWPLGDRAFLTHIFANIGGTQTHDGAYRNRTILTIRPLRLGLWTIYIHPHKHQCAIICRYALYICRCLLLIVFPVCVTKYTISMIPYVPDAMNLKCLLSHVCSYLKYIGTPNMFPVNITCVSLFLLYITWILVPFFVITMFKFPFLPFWFLHLLDKIICLRQTGFY